ncbi:hypothetical protein BKA70DRAFT_1442378 [Coprinopsis sp. MPI-PUGE-AT-0042]|nr:hypothetical protein BKA70DRAFT_1442378 [Coprinopsis sp. MPI-PUGE-AT-0042]
MTSAFTIKCKKTLGGPPSVLEEAEFELVDPSSGVQRQVVWQSGWGFENFMYRTNSTKTAATTSASALGGSMATSPSAEHDDPPQSSSTTA